jgi:hypothetical protein
MQFIDPIDWSDAVDKIGDKTPIGSLLDSDAWSDMPLALRERAFFSSEIESVRFLQSMRDGVTDFLANNKEMTESGEMALKEGSRQQFIKDFQDLAISQGLGPLDPADAGTLKDITSEGRLGLVFDVQTQSAHDFTYWKQGMNPDVLDAYPAQRFIRERDVKTPRPIHQQNEGVVRLKSDLHFWLAMNDPAIGGFGVPWGPWGFGSGMGVEDVEREEAEGMGIIQPGEAVRPVDGDFNDHLEASTHGIDPDMIKQLKESFGDQVEFDEANDVVKWATPAPAAENVVTEESSPSSRPSPPVEGESSSTLVDVLSKLGLDGNAPAEAADMQSLRDELKETDPADAQRLIKFIKGAQPAGAMSDANIQAAVQEFVDFVPPETLARLPKLQIVVKRSANFLGQYGMGGAVDLNAELLAEDPDRARRTIFHELMHWLHREGFQDFRDAIADHFAERTAGERLRQLLGYARGLRGLLDKWYDAYAGLVYPFEMKASGLEVPTRYIEWLTFTPEEMAVAWNDPAFRETMKIVLRGLFR